MKDANARIYCDPRDPAHLYISVIRLFDEVSIWVNFQNNPIARDSVTRYLSAMKSVLRRVVDWTCAAVQIPGSGGEPCLHRRQLKGQVPPMKVVLAAHGTRGDVEPGATVGLELQRRGHDVRMAVPPDLVSFVESAGLAAVGYGPDSQEQVNAVADFLHHAFTLQNPIGFVRAGRELFVEGWAQMGKSLTSLADGADLLVTGQTYHGVVANVAEYYRIPCSGTPPLPDLRQWPARPSVDTIAGSPGPLLIEGGLVAVLADNQRRRRRATP